MSKLEELKLYDDSYWQRYLRENTIFDVDNIKAQKDWLISRLELAEKALSQIDELDEGDPTISLGILAREALQQLRE